MLSAVIGVIEQSTRKYNTEFPIAKSNSPIGLLANMLKLRLQVYKSHGRQTSNVYVYNDNEITKHLHRR